MIAASLSLRALLYLGYALISCVSGFSIFHTKLLYVQYSHLDSVVMLTQSCKKVHILCDYFIVFNDVLSGVSDPDPDSIRSVDLDSKSVSGSRRAKMTHKNRNG
jgi:hypothetical protein